MSHRVDLNRSQFGCQKCHKNTYLEDFYAKSVDGKIIICSQECFDAYRSNEKNRNSMKWYFSFPITQESLNAYIKEVNN